LLRKIKEAVVEAGEHRFLLNQFTLGLDEELVSQWGDNLKAWEVDHKKMNPFEKQFKCMVHTCLMCLKTYEKAAIMQEAVCKCLAMEEAEQMAAGVAYILDEEILASQLIVMGLDFEDQQYAMSLFFIFHLLTFLKDAVILWMPWRSVHM